MAKLSTKSHRCSIQIVNTFGQFLQFCPGAAYRRNADGTWRCRQHLHRVVTAR